jgi:uncharacterized ferritin-like protein (DUF455 family)
VRALRRDWLEGRLVLGEGEPAPIGDPGRPARPPLVPPRELVQRKLTSPEGRAALIHAVAHIEFNAINLALDAVYRFRALPSDYYGDWLQVAVEESGHFEMLRERLQQLGYGYGDFPAHDGLWEMAQDTAHDHLVRMALVPRVLEARGLDVTPGMLARLQAVGDQPTVAILEQILREEIGHVAIGSRWFRYACERRGLSPEPTFRTLLSQYMRGRLRGPFNIDARLAAGFSRDEIVALETMG